MNCALRGDCETQAVVSSVMLSLGKTPGKLPSKISDFCLPFAGFPSLSVSECGSFSVIAFCTLGRLYFS